MSSRPIKTLPFLKQKSSLVIANLFTNKDAFAQSILPSNFDVLFFNLLTAQTFKLHTNVLFYFDPCAAILASEIARVNAPFVDGVLFIHRYLKL